MRRTGKYYFCLTCNKEFYVPAWWKEKGAKYCSRECYWKNKHDIPWNKGTKGLIKINGGCFGSTGIAFKGTIKEYKAVHHRIRKRLGVPGKCLNCLETNRIQWANKSGEYKEDVTDWLPLCKKCHFEYDNVKERRKKYEKR